MKRREMLMAAAGAPLAAAAVTQAAPQNGGRQYLEIRRYSLFTGTSRQRFLNFLRESMFPALNRQGVKPVGAFSVLYGQNDPAYSLYLLLPFDSLETFAACNSRLLEDPEFRQKGAAILDLPLSDPAYMRYHSTLLHAFTGMPRIEPPTGAAAAASRIFEMRTYESHSLKAAKKKIEMFNEGGEIGIFRKTALNPVFFGETLAGAQMPNLVYMLAHENMAARDAGWAAFGSHPDWLALREKAEYKDTVSNITDIILRPAEFSQL